MNAKTEFNIASVTWVKGEVDQVLSLVRQYLEQYSFNPEDNAQIKFCRNHVHQVSGVMEMLGLNGVAVVSREMESLIESLVRQEIKPQPQVLGVLNRATNAISHYLDELIGGAGDNPLRLFPVYRDLMQARGVQSQSITESELFFPDLSVRPPPREVVPPLDPATLEALAKEARAGFQAGLLKWLRSPAPGAPANKDGLQQMFDAVKAIEEIPAPIEQRTFWWASLGFVDGLLHQGLAADLSARRLCAKIEQEIRRLTDGTSVITDQLMREVLYQVARSKPVTERIREICRAYDWHEQLSSGEQDVVKLAAEEEVLRPILEEMRSALAEAKDAWLKYSAGKKESLTLLLACAGKLKQSAIQIKHQPLEKLIVVIGGAAAQLRTQPEVMGEILALEMATSLLLVENALDNFSKLSPEFPRQVEAITARLRSAALGKWDESQLPETPGLDEAGRRTQERELLTQVSHEILANLKQVEQTLDGFFRDPAKRPELPALSPLLKQVAGILTMLGLGRANLLLSVCHGMIVKFSAADYEVKQAEQVQLAEGLSSLSLFIEGLGNEQPGERRSDKLERNNTIEAAISLFGVEVELADAAGAEMVTGERKPAVVLPPPGMMQKLATTAVEISVIPTSLSAVPEAAAPVESVAPAEDAGAGLASAQVAGSVPAPAAPIESAVPTPVAPASASAAAVPAIDPELLEIFLEESVEVLATMAEGIQACSSNPEDNDALTIIRRGFHTLKGSGRMVGLLEMGEVAWGVEQVMNRWLSEAKPASPELLELISHAHREFGGWFASLRETGTARVDAIKLLAAARDLMGGAELEVKAEMLAHSKLAELVGLSEEQLHQAALLEEEQAAEEREQRRQKASGKAEARQNIVIGSAQISPELFDIFSTETRQCMAALESELHGLIETADKPVSHEFMRAAHTLTGISRTLGLEFIADVGFALEQLLALLLKNSVCPGEAAFQPLQDTVKLLGSMLDAVRDRCMPDAADLQAGVVLSRQLGVLLEQIRQLTEDGVAEGATKSEYAEEVEPTEFAEPVTEKTEEPAEVPVEDFVLPITLSPPAVEEIVLLEKAEIPPVIVSPAEIVVTSPAPTKALEPPPRKPVEKRVAAPAAAPAIKPAIATKELPKNERRVVRDDIDPELMEIFVEETQELMPEIGGELRSWREHPQDGEARKALLRALHTLKGSARMAGAMRLGELVHNMESRVEDAPKEGTLPPSLFDALEVEFDRMGANVERLQNPLQDDLEAVETETEAGAEAAVTPAISTPAVASTPSAQPAKATEMPQFVPEEMDVPLQKTVLRVHADLIDRLVNESGEVSITRSRIETELHNFKQSLLDLTENVVRLRNQLREVEIQAETQMQSHMALTQDSEQSFDPLEFDRFTRFQELTRLMAESVNDVSTVQQSMLLAHGAAEAALTQQARMNRDLQQALMRIRAMPFGNFAERFYRVVRQAARDVNKKAHLIIQGGHIEMDRGVLEKISSPLEHLLRNAVAHGIETPARREQQGKSEIGQITIVLRQEGNEIAMILSDDGGGLNVERIREKALQQGLMQADDALSDEQIIQFIFAHGFSTAQEVTEIAGRGVGMDVVKSEISSLGGRVEVASKADLGATFSIYLPLTLAVAQTLMVRAGGHTYAVPAVMVEHVQELKTEALNAAYQNRTVELIGRSYPFTYLPRLLGDLEHVPEVKIYNRLLLLRSGTSRLAVHVDELIGIREVVVKNIGPQLARVPGMEGATVMGDGHIIFIINPVKLMLHDEARVLASASPAMATTPIAPTAVAPVAIPTVMVVDDSLTVRKITSRLLSREGYEVLLAKDGLDAWQQLQEVIPDVMLVDIEMPRMDGFELTRNVRGDSRTKHIPIIIISSRTADKHRNVAKELGVNAFLGKPYQEDELLTHIAEFIKH